MENLYGRYQTARDGSWQTLIDFDIKSLPVSIHSITNTADIKVIKNSVAKELHSSEIGISILADNVWHIIYDDTLSQGRIRFTLAHELGHIFLGHTLSGGYHARTFDTKNDDEWEADRFAADLLAPACVLWALDLHTIEEIQQICNISYTSAKIRSERMEVLYKRDKFLISPLERQVYTNFAEYIENNKK